ncbi:MAG: DUF2283 domain-containing protein [Candidatus Omnitrophota bacterium]
MKFTYDPRYNIAYLRFCNKHKDVETIHISEELNIDLAPDGTIYGIELLNANKQIKREDMGRFLFVDESTGKSAELSLAAA